MLGPLFVSLQEVGATMMPISQMGNPETREVWDLSKVALLGQAGSRVRAANQYSFLLVTEP